MNLWVNQSIIDTSQRHINYSTLGRGNLSGLQSIINEMKS